MYGGPLTWQDLMRASNGEGQYGAPVRAIGQGGSRNAFAPSGYGQGGGNLNPGASIPAGTNINAEWFGRNLDWLTKLPRDQMMSLARTAGTNSPARAPPPTPTPQYFGGGWDGMRQNIGWGPPSNGLAGMGGGYGGMGQSQMGGGMGGGTLGSLLRLFGGGGGY